MCAGGNPSSHILHPAPERLIRAAGLVRVVLCVLHDDHESQPCLLSSRYDLICRKDESIMPVVSQLKGVGVLDALIVGPVCGDSTCLI